MLFAAFSWTCEMWMALGADPVVAHQIMEMVMEKLAVMAPYADKKESLIRGGMMKVATNQPLAVRHRHSDIYFQICQGHNISLIAYLFLRLLELKMTAPLQLHLHAVDYLHILFSLQMTCGLKELLLNGQSQETAVSLFPQLFSCLMVRLGASIGVSAGKQNNKQAASFHVAG